MTRAWAGRHGRTSRARRSGRWCRPQGSTGCDLRSGGNDRTRTRRFWTRSFRTRRFRARRFRARCRGHRRCAWRGSGGWSRRGRPRRHGRRYAQGRSNRGGCSSTARRGARYSSYRRTDRQGRGNAASRGVRQRRHQRCTQRRGQWLGARRLDGSCGYSRRCDASRPNRRSGWFRSLGLCCLGYGRNGFHPLNRLCLNFGLGKFRNRRQVVLRLIEALISLIYFRLKKVQFSGTRLARQNALLYLLSNFRLNGTGVGLLFRHPKFRQQVQDRFRLDFQFPGQLVNSNHT